MGKEMEKKICVYFQTGGKKGITSDIQAEFEGVKGSIRSWSGMFTNVTRGGVGGWLRCSKLERTRVN